MIKKSLYSLIVISILVIGGNSLSKNLPQGSGITDVKSNILIVLATTFSMREDMSVPPIEFRQVNDVETDSYEGNVHSINWNGGHVTLHTYLGAAILDYGKDMSFSGLSAKIQADKCNTMYGKNGGKIQKFTTSPCGGSSFEWNLVPWTRMSDSDGSVNCGSQNDNSDISIYERKSEMFVTDSETDDTCVFDLNGQFLRKIDTTGRSDGGVTMNKNSHNHSTGIDQLRGIMYHWLSKPRKLAVEFIDHDRTNPAEQNPDWPILSEQFPTSIVCAGGHNIDCVTDLEVDSRGDIYISDRNNGTLIKFTGYGLTNTDGTGNGLEYVDKMACNYPGHGAPWNSVYGFGIDTLNDIAWGAAYGRGKVPGINLDDHRDGSHDWTCGMVLTDDVIPRSRMQVATDVLKRIMRDSSLTEGAKFGLMTFDNSTKMHVEVGTSGHVEILNLLENQTLDGDGCLSPDFRCGDPTVETADHKSLAGLGLEDAKKYYGGTLSKPEGGFFTTPIEGLSEQCQNHYVIIMTDDIPDDDPQSKAKTEAALMKASVDNILTYVVGIGDDVSETATALFLQELADAGGTSTPFFAENERTLVAKLKTAIRQVISKTLTFAAPTIMPETTDEGAEESYIYQSVFEYQAGKEWKGSLKKYLLGADGIPASLPVWDSGTVMPLPLQRKIWVPFPEDPPGASLNNFNSGGPLINGKFMNEMWSGNGQTGFPSHWNDDGDDYYETIQFIMGYNSWDTDRIDPTPDDDSDDGVYRNVDRLWYLPDIYHSKPVLVAAPAGSYDSDNEFTESYYRKQNGYEAFYNSNKDRKKLLFAGGNSGLLHAFDLATGIEEWAFMPPSFISKMLDMMPTSYDSTDVTTHVTEPIYGVDGSPLVKDVFIDNEWKTILLCGLGQGGASYFALDITDPTAPTHMFTFENDIAQKRIYVWDATGNKTSYRYSSDVTLATLQDQGATNPVVPADRDYRRLGMAVSTPTIQLIKIDNVHKWVGVFGGGFNDTDTDIGSSVFVIDLEEDGKIIQRIDIDDYIDSGEASVAESEAGAVNTVMNSIPARLIPVSADGTSLATYHGALLYFADYEGKLWKINLSSEGTLYEKHLLFNTKATVNNGRRNFFEVSASIDEVTNNLWLYYGTGDQKNLGMKCETTSGMCNADSLRNKVYGIKDKSFPLTDATISTATEVECTNITGLTSCVVGDSESGWFASLDDNEKVTASPSIKNGIVYFSRYVPDDANNCAAGTAYQSRHDYRVGCAQGSTIPEGETSIKKELGKGVATSAIFYKGKMYLGLSGATDDDTTLEGGADNEGWSLNDNIIVGTQQAGTSSGSGTPIVNWWRQIF